MDRDIILLLVGAGIAFVSSISGIGTTLVLQHHLTLREDLIKRERELAARKNVKEQAELRVSSTAVRLPLPSRPPIREQPLHQVTPNFQHQPVSAN